jgi:hypothetical protein
MKEDICHGQEVDRLLEKLNECFGPVEMSRETVDSIIYVTPPERHTHPFIAEPPLDYFILPIP